MRAHASIRPVPPDPALIGLTPSPVRLSLPAQARNIAVVRRALEAIAEELALPHRVIEDMRLAVTEACTNVVRHAYTEAEAEAAGASAMRVELLPETDGMQVIVEDRGRGLGRSPDAGGPGLGLPLIATLSSRLEVSHGADERGSRIAMWFASAPIEAA
jgi:anti-sigma regulatory factor (Ser/Thr protein kinase)